MARGQLAQSRIDVTARGLLVQCLFTVIVRGSSAQCFFFNIDRGLPAQFLNVVIVIIGRDLLDQRLYSVFARGLFAQCLFVVIPRSLLTQCLFAARDFPPIVAGTFLVQLSLLSSLAGLLYRTSTQRTQHQTGYICPPGEFENRLQAPVLPVKL